MRKLNCYLISAFITIGAAAQTKQPVTASAPQTVARPKLVVGIVIDQMRWDYLYRYYTLYKPGGGFKRLMNDGFSCENTLIPYAPTVTAAGHTCAYTGSVPAIHGIAGNDWYDKIEHKAVYCTDDSTVTTIGSEGTQGRMSPRNLLATTVTDELRLATNFAGKVVGVALKDRASILPAGHHPTGAYWYDYKNGGFITSSYYKEDLPDWVKAFNSRNLVDSLYALNWDISMPADVYTQYSTADYEKYENSKSLGKDSAVFPYDLSRYIGKDYGKIAATPYGNTLTLEMAKAAVTGEDLGKDDITDFLAVSFSSPDYVGHSFGPNSWEQLDDYVRLDETLGKLLDFLDASVGKNQYTVFLTADHGVAHAAGFMKEMSMPGGLFDEGGTIREMNAKLKDKYGKEHIIRGIFNYQVVLNNELLDSTEYINREDIVNWVVNYLQQQPAVSRAFRLDNLANVTMNSTQKNMITNGYYPSRCGDIQFILKPGFYEGGATGTTHGAWNPYDAHIPLLFYGWGIKHGKLNRETYMTDIAPTIAALLHIQMPSGCVGHVIEDVMK
ncbi:MAG TPA: alkaline phosphatase PafA [Chitinophagaceae bacterium]|nr:alkaline phosphatase PafA [Chitinophagaceae bacterium]